MLFVGTSIIHPSTEGVFLLCNILDLLIYRSYFIIFEDNYFPPDMFTDDIIIPTKDNCFVIKCPDGQYAFYLYGKYITTFPNKEHCIIGITTYKNIQEARKHEKIISEK